MDVLWGCLIRFRNHKQCISIAPELKRESGTNYCESNALAISLSGMILNGSLNINSKWYSAYTRQRVFRATDFWENQMNDSQLGTNNFQCWSCMDWDKCYIDHTGRKVATRTREHNLATRRHHPLSLTHTHTENRTRRPRKMPTQFG